MFPSLFPLALLPMFTKTRTNKMGISTKQNNVLKVVHAGHHVEIFTQPITAGELMRKYPRHCIARPDVFQFPWIVVRPESVLVPGKVFYLMPYRTLDKLLKAKGKEQQSSEFNSPTKALAGVTPRYRQNAEVFRRELHDNEDYYCVGKHEQEFDAESLYKLEFYESWNKMRTIIDQPYSGLDNGGRGERVLNPDERVESSVIRPKSCLTRPDSDRKKLNLKVSFASQVVIFGSRRVSLSFRQDD